MPANSILSKLQDARRQGKKLIAVLIDPDKTTPDAAAHFAGGAEEAGVDLLMIGGSLMTSDRFQQCVRALKASSALPLLIFPGDSFQVDAAADALLLLSLISGRNPDLLIGRHVQAAPLLRRSGLELIPTAYLLIDGGKPTAASYMSHTLPIPNDKPDIACCTAMAGEMLGLQCLYMDAGSGAGVPVAASMISAVRQAVEIPIIVGGGLRDSDQAKVAFEAGADVVVIGTAIERNPDSLREFTGALRYAFPAVKI
jgi:phosphoglycerol geranylgeranyltransferase